MAPITLSRFIVLNPFSVEGFDNKCRQMGVIKRQFITNEYDIFDQINYD